MTSRRKKARKIHRVKSRPRARRNSPKLKARFVNFNDPLERAIKLMQEGKSQRAAAKAEGIPVGRLRRHITANVKAKLKDRKWIIIDRRPVPFRIVTDGQIKEIIGSRRSASIAGRYWNAVNRYMDSNFASDLKRLKVYDGVRLRDINGRYHQLETRPNVLRRLDSADELSFLEMYAEVAK